MSEEMKTLAPGRWRCGFYTQKPWRFDYHRWGPGFIGRPPHDSPPRSYDAILSVGPLRWRIYREHPWDNRLPS